MARITSTHNPAVKYVRSLDKSRTRRAEGVYLAEGVRLVAEAAASGQSAALVLYDPDLLRRSAAGSSLLDAIPGWAERSYEVDERVLGVAAQTETPSGVLAVLRDPSWPPLSSHREDRFGVILDRLADPGNAGTILRTADAAGVGYVAALAGTVDLYTPKVVRAGMGAHFRIPVYQNLSWDQIGADLSDVSLVNAAAHLGASIYEFEWPQPGALVIGSEAHGLSSHASARARYQVHIPMRGGAESLNASVAASIVIYTVLGPTIRAE